MEQQNQRVSERWLEVHAPGFRYQPVADRQAIYDFTFLWSLFEARIMNNYARTDRIAQTVDAWVAAGTLESNLYESELLYFRNRYFSNGALTDRFLHLHFRAADNLEIVQAVLEGTSDSQRYKTLCLLMIIWRLRNNLFHGEKWTYQFSEQLENFTNANNVLMRIIEHHSQFN